jgi:hypothetical protein
METNESVKKVAITEKAKQRGIFEKKKQPGVYWIRYVDAQGRFRREKAGTLSTAKTLYHKRKNEALQGIVLPENLRRKHVHFQRLPKMLCRIPRLTSAAIAATRLLRTLWLSGLARWVPTH